MTSYTYYQCKSCDCEFRTRDSTITTASPDCPKPTCDGDVRERSLSSVAEAFD
jgi:hypothetical protein